MLAGLVAEGMEPRVLSLFTGGGGLDIGLEQAGMEIAACVDIDPDRCDILTANRPDWNVINADVRQLDGPTLVRRARLRSRRGLILSGAAPCQGFSKAAFWLPNRFNPHIHDNRKTLVYEFARLVSELRPTAFIFENVASLAYPPNNRYLARFLALVKRSGYVTAWKVVNAVQYGVPQRRERVIVVGSRNGIHFNFPEPIHALTDAEAKKGLRKPVTSGDAIGDLDDRQVGIKEAPGGKWGHLLREVPPGQNYLHFTARRGYSKPIFAWRSRYYSFLAKLDPGMPSWTIPAHPAYYGGPFHWRSRWLRISEAKRLQTLPDNWVLPPSRAKAWSAIGDAVPPLLGRTFGRAILDQIAA